MSNGNFGMKDIGKASSRGIKDGRGDNMFTIYAARDHPREYVLKRDSEKWGAEPGIMKNYINQVINLTEPPFNQLNGIELSILTSDNEAFDLSKSGRLLTRSSLVKINHLVEQPDGALMCTRCGAAMFHSVEITRKLVTSAVQLNLINSLNRSTRTMTSSNFEYKLSGGKSNRNHAEPRRCNGCHANSSRGTYSTNQ